MPNSQPEGARNLTDADIEAIIAAVKQEFYANLGKGFWKIVWQAVMVALVGVAAYGALKR